MSLLSRFVRHRFVGLRGKNGAGAALALALASTPALACTAPTPTTNQMAVLQPCSPSLVTWNQVTPGLSYIALSDTDMMVPASTKTPISVQAPGMQNVEVWAHGKFVVRLVGDGVGGFSGTWDTSKEFTGPVVVAVYGWNSSPPGNNNFTFAVAATMEVFIKGGIWPPKPTPVAASANGLKLVWQQYFNTPSMAACKTGTGIWPNCAAPTAADGFTFYENKPGGGDFGDAANEHSDGPFNPFYFAPAGGPGYIRIRATKDLAYKDPYGFNRTWRSGFLATAFPDGTSNLPPMNNGYYEAKILLPPGSGASWNTGQSGGTWTGWWMLDRDAIKDNTIGNIEYDIEEGYSVDYTKYHVNVHTYAPATGPNGPIYFGAPLPKGADLSWDFHTFGLLITDTTVTAYLDDVVKGSLPKSMLPGGKPLNMFMMAQLQMGSGWPKHAPPAGYYDMWIRDMRFYGL